MAIFEQLDVIPDEEYDNYLYVTNSIVKIVMYSQNCNSNNSKHSNTNSNNNNST